MFALDLLHGEKGVSAVLRKADYLFSKCKSPEAVDYVLDAIRTDDKILLVRLLLHYSRSAPKARCVFKFQKFDMVRIHAEAPEESCRRTAVLDTRIVSRVLERLRQELATAKSSNQQSANCAIAMKSKIAPALDVALELLLLFGFCLFVLFGFLGGFWLG